MSRTATFSPQGPYNLALSLRIARRFVTAGMQEADGVLRAAVRLDGEPWLVQVEQVQHDPPLLHVSSPAGQADRLCPQAAWILFAELDLRPFYCLAAEHPILGPISRELYGLKPQRPSTLFEMAVIAITEQQISMAAAHSIRQRVIERYGDAVDGLWAFPTPERLARASLGEFVACGLSRRKAEYLSRLAGAVAAGDLDLEGLRDQPDDVVRETIMGLRGFGPWSAEYILVRGLGRPDSLPADDLGVRTVVGRHLGDGARMTADEVRHALAPLAPYRGLAAFYLLAAVRLHPPEHREGPIV